MDKEWEFRKFQIDNFWQLKSTIWKKSICSQKFTDNRVPKNKRRVKKIRSRRWCIHQQRNKKNNLLYKLKKSINFKLKFFWHSPKQLYKNLLISKAQQEFCQTSLSIPSLLRSVPPTSDLSLPYPLPNTRIFPLSLDPIHYLFCSNLRDASLLQSRGLYLVSRSLGENFLLFLNQIEVI